jgi:acyl carrier protein
MDPKIVNILTECLNVSASQIVPEAHIINDLGADSLDTVEIVMRLEDTFDIQVEDEDSEKMFTVQDIVTYIESL